MRCEIGDVSVHYVEHGDGLPVLVLHGAGVDHREAEACFEPALAEHGGLRRIYLDLPGMGQTWATEALESADDVLDMLLRFADELAGKDPVAVLGHSAGAYYGYGLAVHRPERVRGLALVCPLLPGVRDVPEHRPVIAAADLGDEQFRCYFVVQTAAMLDRYNRFVAPAAALVDTAAMERIGQRWELSLPKDPAYAGPALVIAGRQDSTVGHAAALDLLDTCPHATVAVIDGTGHALPHEQPELLAALLEQWLTRTDPPAE